MTDEICWVETIADTEATGDLKAAYDRVRRPDGGLDNLYQAFSLLPSAILPADDHYRAVMHGGDGPLEPWLRELISVQAALLAGCDYALTHHGCNFRQLYGDPAKAEAMIAALDEDNPPARLFDTRVRAMLAYGAKLAKAPEAIVQGDIEALRAADISDREIVHLNQISASFAYWVRVINGLGICLGDEPVGLTSGERDTIKARWAAG